jgi:O-antigen ligase
METLFEVETYQNRNLFSIANEFVFAERILYWQTGWHVFNDYPIFGVGLGNVGFFFEEYMPSFAWALDEPRHLIYQANYQGNVKNLWIRLLSETGIIGFLCFGTWLILLFLRSYQFQRNESHLHKYWGLVGKIALLTLLIEGFSIDSFALPYYWIIFGFLSNKYLESSIES